MKSWRRVEFYHLGPAVADSTDLETMRRLAGSFSYLISGHISTNLVSFRVVTIKRCYVVSSPAWLSGELNAVVKKLNVNQKSSI